MPSCSLPPTASWRCHIHALPHGHFAPAQEQGRGLSSQERAFFPLFFLALHLAAMIPARDRLQRPYLLSMLGFLLHSNGQHEKKTLKQIYLSVLSNILCRISKSCWQLLSWCCLTWTSVHPGRDDQLTLHHRLAIK